jgi:hypothetical protein
MVGSCSHEGGAPLQSMPQFMVALICWWQISRSRHADALLLCRWQCFRWPSSRERSLLHAPVLAKLLKAPTPPFELTDVEVDRCAVL